MLGVIAAIVNTMLFVVFVTCWYVIHLKEKKEESHVKDCRFPFFFLNACVPRRVDSPGASILSIPHNSLPHIES